MSIVDPKHPLARGLRSLWLPSLDAGESALRNYAGGEAAKMPFPAAADAPQWAVGSVGAALDFDGVSDYLSTTDLPWRPLTEGGDITVAVYAEIFAYPTSSTTELWSSQYAPGTADRVIATLGLRASSSTIRARICLNENGGGSSGSPSIAWPPLRVPFLCVFTSRGEFDHEMALLAPGQGVPAFSTDTNGRQPLASFNPTSEVIANEIYAGATDAAFSGRIYGAWVWNRGFRRDELTAFLLDPFGLLEQPRIGAGISQAASFDGQAPTAGTVTTTWSVATRGTATASAVAAGGTLATAWTVATRGLATGTGDGVAAGKALASTWSVIGGTATAANPAGGKLLSTAWTVIPGAAAATATAPTGGTLTTTWTVAPGIAGQVFPPKPQGGGTGPGGFGAGVSAQDRARIRNALRKVQAKHGGEKFWPDPADLTPDELEEWAAKAAAEVAAEAVPKGESNKQMRARIEREALAFLEYQEKQRRNAIFLLMVN